MSKLVRMILLSLAMVMCLCVVGCGKDAETSPSPSADAPTQSGDATSDAQTSNPTNAPTQAPTDVPAESPSATPETFQGEGAVLWQISVKDALTMSYVIKTKNNKIIVIDGGGDSNSGKIGDQKYPKKEIEELMKVLKEATGEQVPTIDAWILTHCHSDHINVFSHMTNHMKGTVNVKKIYYNFPTDDYMYKYGSMSKDSNSTLSKFKNAIANYSEDQIVIVQKGESYTVDNVKFNMILVPEEQITSLRVNAINESSIVFDMKLGGQRVLFLGDLGPYSNTRLRKAMRETESEFVDVVQMAHHGSQGVSKECYWTLEPKVCLWPTPDWLWNSDNGWETTTVYNYLVKKGVQQHYIMKDGTVKLTFPLDLG